MAKGRSTAADTIDEIEGLGERAGEWLSANAKAVFVGAMVCLAIAGGYGAWDTHRSNREESAADALSQVRLAYLTAMGAQPFALEVPELANPEAGVAIREDFAQRFSAVAEANPGTTAGALAALEASNLREAAGTPMPLEDLEAIADGLPSDAGISGLVYERIAQVHEEAERWSDAGAVYERAAGIEDYPLRDWALASAARCYAAAGDDARAVALFARLESEAPDLKLPDYLRSRLEELRARSGS